MTDIDLMQQLADGYKTSEISINLKTNIHTVKKRIKELKKKTGCPTIANLVADFLRKQMID